MIKTFEQWTFEELEITFGLQRVKTLAALEEWLNIQAVTITESERDLLSLYQNLLIDKVDIWNEEELKVFFIGPLLSLIGYHQAHYRPFLERAFSAQIGEIKLQGVVDFMLASGKLTPKQPFFCLHEYKRIRGRANDPLGQLLAAMLCAQAKNGQAEQPIYGLFIEGRFWYFVVLAGKDYAMTEPFTATQADLWDIFKMLRLLKTFIDRTLATNLTN